MTAAAVAAKLGGKRVLRRDITSEMDLAEAVRAGLPATALEFLLAELASWVNSATEVYRLVGSPRTLQRKRTGRVTLSADESDRLARVARMLVRAEEALGDVEKAYRWMSRPNRALGGRVPLSLLDSDAGSLLVERVLGRVEHGVYS